MRKKRERNRGRISIRASYESERSADFWFFSVNKKNQFYYYTALLLYIHTHTRLAFPYLVWPEASIAPKFFLGISIICGSEKIFFPLIFFTLNTIVRISGFFKAKLFSEEALEGRGFMSRRQQQRQFI